MGLLDDFSSFIKTPEGMGLLSAVAGGLAGAQRGAPINSIGRAGLAGVMGYGNALDRQERTAENALQNQFRQMQLAEMKRKQESEQRIRDIAKSSMLTPEQQSLNQFATSGVGGFNPPDPSQFKPTFDTQGFIRKLMADDPLKALELKQSLTPKPLTVGKNDRVIDPNTFKTIIDAQPDLPTGMRLNANGQMEYDPNYIAGQKEIRAAGKAVSNTNVFNNTKDDFKNERDLRNDFAGLPTTKAFNEVQSAYDQIQVAIKKESPAGDLAAATKIMKILDPGSVVRESELGMAMQASGLMDRVANYANMIQTGQKLTPTQRKDFGDLATQLYQAAADRYDSSADEMRGVAKKYNLDPDRVAPKAKRSAIGAGGWSASRVNK